MSKVSRRPGREEIEKIRREKKKAEKVLRARQKAEGLKLPSKAAIPNRTCRYKTVEEEQEARQDATTEQVRVFRATLPVLLKRLSSIDDPRNPKKIKHRHTLLMIYGILTFVLQMASRREANREMTRPMFMENLKLLFPELEDLPHHDTLMRLLARIEVGEIESTLIALVRTLIRNKKFLRYVVDNRYPIAIDGTQKCVRDVLWAEQCLEREVGKGDDTHTQYYVYVLEASLAFAGGMTIPLMSEFLSYTQGDTATKRQDCEQKAFKRLAKKLKDEFGHLPIMVLLDGLYPNGPIMELCRKNKWDFMIVLQDKSLKSVWEEYEGLNKLEGNNHLSATWGNRRQGFHWVNGIEYYYGPHERKRQIVHVVVCEERWEEIARDSAEVVTKESRHVWISSKPLTRGNVHERCNLAARHRWDIESDILVEKRHGYHYEHVFSYNWNAMKGYHYLMRLGHLINVLALYSERLVKMVRELGVQGFIRFVRETITGPWLDPLWVKRRLAADFQLRLI
ncbi:MAG TPA: transposase family protein [Acidobacteriota bacterium]|nr:transposase family protein [Acidobacteriota bacterium]